MRTRRGDAWLQQAGGARPLARRGRMGHTGAMIPVNWFVAAAASGVIAHALLWATWRLGRGAPAQVGAINAATFLFLYFAAPIRVESGDTATIQQWFTMCAGSQIVWTILDLLFAPRAGRWLEQRFGARR